MEHVLLIPNHAISQVLQAQAAVMKMHTCATVPLASLVTTVPKILMNVSPYQLQSVNLPASMMVTVPTSYLVDLSVIVHQSIAVIDVKLTSLHVIQIHVRIVEPVSRMGYQILHATVPLATLA